MIIEENPALKSDNLRGLIGTHLPSEEDLDNYAKKNLQTATGINDVYLKQVQTFGATNRVPYYRILTVAYYALINPDYHDLKLSPLAKIVKWFDIDKLPNFIFDTKKIINEALRKLSEEVKYHPIGFNLLPKKFALTHVQTLCEVIFEQALRCIPLVLTTTINLKWKG